MRKTVSFALLSTVVLAAGVALAAPRQKTAPGSLVIVFKDGHRQTFNLADIERLEYPAGTLAASDMGPTREGAPHGRYVGKWKVGDGGGNTFFITLNENGSAYRSLGDVHGHWTYTNGDALITWEDGAKDAIRRTGSRFQKFAYLGGKSFSDDPDNVTEALNTSPRPI